jgi:hypothetical protein
MTKLCIDCQQEKPLEMFYDHEPASDGKSCYCILCQSIRNKTSAAKYRAKNYISKKKNQKLCFNPIYTHLHSSLSHENEANTFLP